MKNAIVRQNVNWPTFKNSWRSIVELISKSTSYIKCCNCSSVILVPSSVSNIFRSVTTVKWPTIVKEIEDFEIENEGYLIRGYLFWKVGRWSSRFYLDFSSKIYWHTIERASSIIRNYKIFGKIKWTRHATVSLGTGCNTEVTITCAKILHKKLLWHLFIASLKLNFCSIAQVQMFTCLLFTDRKVSKRVSYFQNNHKNTAVNVN